MDPRAGGSLMGTIGPRPVFNAALEALRRKVFAGRDYWWARRDIGKSASAHDNRPTTLDDFFNDEWVGVVRALS
jgi:hypothetical protein